MEKGKPNGKWSMLDTHREGKNSLPTYTFRLTFNTKNVVTYLRIILTLVTPGFFGQVNPRPGANSAPVS